MISQETLDKLWTPKLVFVNAVGNYETIADEQAVASINLETESKLSSFDSVYEGLQITS